jgi:hypothetical protein
MKQTKHVMEFLHLPNLASVIEKKKKTSIRKKKYEKTCIYFKCFPFGSNHLNLDLNDSPFSRFVIPKWFVKRSVDFKIWNLFGMKTHEREAVPFRLDRYWQKKKREENSYSHFGRLFWCSSLTLFISYPTPDRWFLNAFLAWGELRTKKCTHLTPKLLLKVSFFFFFLYVRRKKHAH